MRIFFILIIYLYSISLNANQDVTAGIKTNTVKPFGIILGKSEFQDLYTYVFDCEDINGYVGLLKCRINPPNPSDKFNQYYVNFDFEGKVYSIEATKEYLKDDEQDIYYDFTKNLINFLIEKYNMERTLNPSSCKHGPKQFRLDDTYDGEINKKILKKYNLQDNVSLRELLELCGKLDYNKNKNSTILFYAIDRNLKDDYVFKDKSISEKLDLIKKYLSLHKTFDYYLSKNFSLEECLFLTKKEFKIFNQFAPGDATYTPEYDCIRNSRLANDNFEIYIETECTCYFSKPKGYIKKISIKYTAKENLLNFRTQWVDYYTYKFEKMIENNENSKQPTDVF